LFSFDYDQGYSQGITSGGYLFVTLEQFLLVPFFGAWWYCLFCLYCSITGI